MFIRSGRHVLLLWAAAIGTFVVSAAISTALLPQGPVDGPPASYWAGLVGLLAVGAAIVLTWSWAGREGPSSPSARARVAIRGALVVLGALWVVAMLFPFL